MTPSRVAGDAWRGMRAGRDHRAMTGCRRSISGSQTCPLDCEPIKAVEEMGGRDY
jgi:hypothetical protein